MLYKDLSDRLACLASTEGEYRTFVELTTQHFEGKLSFDKLPDSVKIALKEWEEENTFRADNQ